MNMETSFRRKEGIGLLYVRAVSSHEAFNDIFSQPFKHNRTVDRDGTELETDTTALDPFKQTNSVFYSDNNESVSTVTTLTEPVTPVPPRVVGTATKKRMGRPVGS